VDVDALNKNLISVVREGESGTAELKQLDDKDQNNVSDLDSSSKKPFS